MSLALDRCVLAHLSARALLRTSAACALLCAVRAAGEGSVWDGVLSHPWIAPYRKGRPPRDPTAAAATAAADRAAAPPCDGDGEVAFLAAAQRRRSWLEI